MGRSIGGVQISDTVMARIVELQQRVESNQAGYLKYIAAHADHVPTAPRFHVEANDTMELTIYEAATGTRFPARFAIID
jgi:hypothetical protein